MIRFEPDTLGQALMRFFDMAAPDSNVYIEIPAPDIRFAAILLLAVAAALLWRRLGPGRGPTFAFLAVLFASTAVWLKTSGNGRYFMAMLVCAGPVAIALVCMLPITRAFKSALALLLVGGQAFVLFQQPPWNTWTMAHWKDGPYFEVSLGPEEKQARPATYVSLSVLSYSLVAPQFPATARWTNLHASPFTQRDADRAEAFMRRALAEGPVRLFVPGMPEASLPDGTPNPEMVKALDKMVAPHQLRIEGRCRFLGSPGLVQMATRGQVDHAAAPGLGFWSCPLAHDAGAATAVAREKPPEQVLQVLARLSELCPRFFPSAQARTLRAADGWSRHFLSDTRVYVLDNGEVWYKFWRSLNPVRVGTVPALLAGEATVECPQIRGSDRPWQTGVQ